MEKKLKLILSIIQQKLTLILFIIAALIAVLYYVKYQRITSLLNDPNELVKLETQGLVNKIGKSIEMPANELPTLATVTDKNKLPSQPFFSQAQNGDKLLIYQKAKKAILYRPSTDKIIEIGPVTGEDKGTAEVAAASTQIKPINVLVTPTSFPTLISPSPSPTTKIKVAIYNGTKINGLAALTERQLYEKMPQIEVVKKTDAHQDYSETLVVDLSNNKETAEKLAQFVSGKVSSLPQGEIVPEADILIILGR